MPTLTFPDHFQVTRLVSRQRLSIPFIPGGLQLSSPGGCTPPPAGPAQASPQDAALSCPSAACPHPTRPLGPPESVKETGGSLDLAKWGPGCYHSQGFFRSNMKIIAKSCGSEPHMGSRDRACLSWLRACRLIFPGKGFPRRGGVGFEPTLGLVEI